MDPRPTHEEIMLALRLDLLRILAVPNDEDNGNDADYDDDEEHSNVFKCPVCQQRHRPSMSLSQRPCSHGSLLVFVTAPCPICLEEKAGPPMVALPCGHLLCPEDFTRMGGALESKDTPNTSRTIQQTQDFRSIHLDALLERFRLFHHDAYTSVMNAYAPTHASAILWDEDEDDESDDSYVDHSYVGDYYYGDESEDDEDSNDDSQDDDDDDDDDDDSSGHYLGMADRNNGNEDFCWSTEQSDQSRWSNLDVLSLPDHTLTSSPTRRRVPNGGVWLIIPSSHSCDVNSLVYTNLHECIWTPGHYPTQSRLVASTHGVWIRIPQENRQCQVRDVNLNRSLRKYDVTRDAQVQVDGHGGMWALEVKHGRQKDLIYYNFRNPQGRLQRKVPMATYLVMDPTGGVWMHVKRPNEQLQSGLWHVQSGRMRHVHMIAPDDVCAADGKGGIWVLMQEEEPPQLLHVATDGTQRIVEVDCPSHKDNSIIRGVVEQGEIYLHCKLGDRWALCIVASNGEVTHICPCPRDARVVGDGAGGAWLLRKVGRDNSRTLTHVNSQKEVIPHDMEFPAGTQIVGR